MKINQAGLDIITEFEGFVPRWYKDPAGVWTIGYGHTDAAGTPRRSDNPSLTISQKEARDMLSRDVKSYEDSVSALVKVPLNENQFSALVSFTYNLGAGNLGRSTLLKKLNAGDYQGAADQFEAWNKAGGKVLNGLVRRREAERELFVKPVSKPTTVTTPVATSIMSFLKSLSGEVK